MKCLKCYNFNFYCPIYQILKKFEKKNILDSLLKLAFIKK